MHDPVVVELSMIERKLNVQSVGNCIGVQCRFAGIRMAAALEDATLALMVVRLTGLRVVGCVAIESGGGLFFGSGASTAMLGR